MNGKSFITKDFLLQSDFAKKLYHHYAKDLPIIDYHCHLSPADIARNRQFENITRIWLEGDHYKWRAMRTLGVEEKFVTGDADDKDKFQKWAEVVPFTIRNPLYHWTHLELSRYFNIDDLLSGKNASAVYQETSELLQNAAYSTQTLLKKMNVVLVGTTDDPIDTLEHHAAIAASDLPYQVVPSFRPDRVYDLTDLSRFKQYLLDLGQASHTEISSYDSLLEALKTRIEFFHHHGCRMSDHGLEQIFPQVNENPLNENNIFYALLSGKQITEAEKAFFKSRLLIELGKMYHAKGWTQQFHLGAMRNNNQRMRTRLGADAGFDSVGDYPQAVSLSRFLDKLDQSNQLARTILYNLNPSDNEVIATMTGNFNDGSMKGKVQFGSGWWFLDQKDGMEKQLNALSNMSLLSCFIGMITDSRSFLSYPRHEYFRRILCNLIAQDVAKGELPADEKWLGKIVSDICFYNAKEYLGFKV